MTTDPRQRLVENPFFVLGLPIDCARADAEREAGKLLGLLALGVAAAARYRSPLGVHPRTADDVRRAISELRDPVRRLQAELWAADVGADPGAGVGASVAADVGEATTARAAAADAPVSPRWPDALDALALRPRAPRARP